MNNFLIYHFQCYDISLLLVLLLIVKIYFTLFYILCARGFQKDVLRYLQPIACLNESSQ